MAGPGGGPPRKSHTKSRKGCKTCKKRHIRCDENFPQCRNCTKHNCRCDYMDIPAAGEEPLKGSKPPDLMTSPELQQALDKWRLTGESPFPELRTADPRHWCRFSTVDLRLLYHIVSLSGELHKRGYSSCTAWAPQMPRLITVALSNNFVMSAVLALSAAHLAWQTNNSDTENLAYYHRGVALKGLHEALGAFSRNNSDAILAASMLLSWQATEWRSWASLQQGVSTVMNAMRPWAHESELAKYLDDQRSQARTRDPMRPNDPATQTHVRSEDISRLEHITRALNDLRLRLTNYDELLAPVDQLRDYLRQMREDFPLQAPEEAFERLQALRSYLFWLPPILLRPQESDIGAIAVLSHYYAVALALEPLFPEIGGSYLGTMSVAPLEQLHSILLARRKTSPREVGAQVALSLLETPLSILTAYKSWRGQLAQSSEAYRFSPQNHSTTRSIQLTATPDIPSATLYSNTPLRSPGNLHLPTGSYFPSISSSEGTPRNPTFRSQPMTVRNYNAGSPLSGPPMAYPPQTQAEYGMIASLGDSGHAAHHYGINSRFVTPSPLWT